ncbi:MAG: cell wall hydrolase [Sulfurimonas sp.]|jgi:spore germination cell wall hydrolase CwlJ-like protein|uniref:cell wall hydrolase n=1 Tax=Sulfurimonas sp. TaxID=2022749 RepID=UPI003568E336
MVNTQWIEWLFWLTINLYFEARGESREGQVAICHVVLNRAARRGQSVDTVIRASKQFSWYNEGIVPMITEPTELIKCAASVMAAFGERMQGKTLWGSDHYFNPNVVRPPWAAKMARTCLIGNHEFYRS